MASAYLTSINGVARKNALLILAEGALLPEDTTGREGVAYAGLGPRWHQSGKPVEKKERVAKVSSARRWRALCMPAFAAIRWKPNINALL